MQRALQRGMVGPHLAVRTDTYGPRRGVIGGPLAATLSLSDVIVGFSRVLIRFSRVLIGLSRVSFRTLLKPIKTLLKLIKTILKTY
jgi:hypothetical protein